MPSSAERIVTPEAFPRAHDPPLADRLRDARGARAAEAARRYGDEPGQQMPSWLGEPARRGPRHPRTTAQRGRCGLGPSAAAGMLGMLRAAPGSSRAGGSLARPPSPAPALVLAVDAASADRAARTLLRAQRRAARTRLRLVGVAGRKPGWAGWADLRAALAVRRGVRRRASRPKSCSRARSAAGGGTSTQISGTRRSVRARRRNAPASSRVPARSVDRSSCARTARRTPPEGAHAQRVWPRRSKADCGTCTSRSSAGATAADIALGALRIARLDPPNTYESSSWGDSGPSRVALGLTGTELDDARGALMGDQLGETFDSAVSVCAHRSRWWKRRGHHRARHICTDRPRRRLGGRDRPWPVESGTARPRCTRSLAAESRQTHRAPARQRGAPLAYERARAEPAHRRNRATVSFVIRATGRPVQHGGPPGTPPRPPRDIRVR